MTKAFTKTLLRAGLFVALTLLIACGGSTSSQSSSSSSSSGATINPDPFGITQFYPDAPQSMSWNSSHWSAGGVRPLAASVGARDVSDPTGWSQLRGSGNPTLQIMGDGRMQMSGTQPRLYINPYPSGSSNPGEAEHLFTNVEFTGYFRRRSDAGANYGGFVVGLRSGPEGHGSANGNNCDATTYYARIRNDGKWQFEKELKHPASSSVGTYHLWPNNTLLPTAQWIGLKFVMYTLLNGDVYMKAWIDHTEGLNGGSWQLLGEYTDTGNWHQDADYGTVDASDCDYDNNHVIAPGGGTVFIRNTEGETEYKWVTIREIRSPEE